MGNGDVVPAGAVDDQPRVGYAAVVAAYRYRARPSSRSDRSERDGLCHRPCPDPIQEGDSPGIRQTVVLAEVHLVRPVARVEVSAPRPIGQRRPRLERRAGTAVDIDGLAAARAPLDESCHLFCLTEGRTPHRSWMTEVT
jgi:hypothetical protein